MGWRLIRAVLVVALASGCRTDNSPCVSACPPLEGSYQLTLDGAGSGDCGAMGLTQAGGVLQILQDGSSLSATFDGQPYDGIAYDTQDFTLNRTGTQPDGGGTDTASLRGTYLPPSSLDGGVDGLSGTFLRTVRDQPQTGPARTCTFDQTFSGTRL